MDESVFGVYAKNGWHMKALSFEYSRQPALSTLVAGILSEIRGISVVSSDKGNIFSHRFLAPLGDTKYAQVPKALMSLWRTTSFV